MSGEEYGRVEIIVSHCTIAEKPYFACVKSACQGRIPFNHTEVVPRSMSVAVSHRMPVIAGVLAVLALAVSTSFAQPYIELGQADSIAIDQPRIAVEVYEPPDNSFGPYVGNTWALDTGAQGLLAAMIAYDEMAAEGYTTVAQYEETGVGGTSMLDLSAEYNFRFAGTAGTPIYEIPNVTLLSSDSLYLGSFGGVAGMPVMVNRVTSLDIQAMGDKFRAGDFFPYIEVAFDSTVPASGGHRYSVPLTLVDFPPIGQQNPSDPLPTYEPIPAVDVVIGHGDTSLSRSFIVDTGAQMSAISTTVAFALGLDTDGDGNFQNEKISDVTFGGIGPPVTAPVLAVDQLRLPTAEGPEIVLSGLELAVIDIDPAIHGLFGMNLLMSGWGDIMEYILGLKPDFDDGYFRQVHFDFTDAGNMAGTMLLDLNAEFDVLTTIAGDTNFDGDVDDGDLNILLTNFGQSGMDWSSGDFNGDLTVNDSDLNLLLTSFGSTPTAPGVPEPATMTLLMLGSLAVIRRRRCR